MNLNVATVQNRIYAKNMPFPVYKEGANYLADLNDVADYERQIKDNARQAHAAQAAAFS